MKRLLCAFGVVCLALPLVMLFWLFCFPLLVIGHILLHLGGILHRLGNAAALRISTRLRALD